MLLDLAVALGQLRAEEVEGAQRLLEREQVFGPPVALQALGDVIDTGADARVLHRAQHLAVPLTGDDGAQDLLARLAVEESAQNRGSLRGHCHFTVPLPQSSRLPLLGWVAKCFR